jgi:hypothetical protein
MVAFVLDVPERVVNRHTPSFPFIVSVIDSLGCRAFHGRW